MKKLLILYLVIQVKVVCAQDVHLTQYFVAPQLINPAAFGVLNDFEGGLLYKSQWNSFTKGFTTYSAFVNKQIRIKEIKSGFFSVGLNSVYDKAGDGSFTSVVAGIPVNYSVKLNKNNFFTLGLNASFNQKTISATSLTWGSQFDGLNYNQALPGENRILQMKSAVDFGTGMAWISKKTGKTFTNIQEPVNILGFSAAHLNRPSYSFYGASNEKMKIRYNLYEYFHYYFDGSNLSIVPSLMVQRQGTANEFIFGTMMCYKINNQSRITGINQSSSLDFGFFYRMKDALTLNTMIEYKNYIFGASYDVNVSRLKQSSKLKGGLEVFFKIKNPYKYLYKGFSSW
ncbi:MAG: PorP/SprF family type IX secretion system membrane protein [Bacteroidetes bacterium]|nr:PorP/SprF family type IX secretion system membrane protein [Bacteroidota bacterium]